MDGMGHIGTWNVSRVTNMSRLFEGCSSFNEDIHAWDTSAVIDMAHMFRNATQFNQPIGTWNTSAVTSMEAMFDGAAEFNQPIHTWDISAVTNMERIFDGAMAFNQTRPVFDVDTGHWSFECLAGHVRSNGTCHPCAHGLVASKGATTCYRCEVGAIPAEDHGSCRVCPFGTFAEQGICRKHYQIHFLPILATAAAALVAWAFITCCCFELNRHTPAEGPAAGDCV